MKLKKCCYFDRDCTTACVAYSAANELSEGAKNLGMKIHSDNFLSLIGSPYSGIY